jgi:hypothetical protein
MSGGYVFYVWGVLVQTGHPKILFWSEFDVIDVEDEYLPVNCIEGSGFSQGKVAIPRGYDANIGNNPVAKVVRRGCSPLMDHTQDFRLVQLILKEELEEEYTGNCERIRSKHLRAHIENSDIPQSVTNFNSTKEEL